MLLQPDQTDDALPGIISGLKHAASLAERAFLEVGEQFEHIGTLVLGGTGSAPALHTACREITIELQMIDRFLQHQMAAIAALEAWHKGAPAATAPTAELLMHDATPGSAELFQAS